MDNNQNNILDKFSADFISKYKYCPITNSVIRSLQNGADVWSVMESVLQGYEDTIRREIAEKIERITLGQAPQYIVSTQEVINEFMNRREITTDIIQKCIDESVNLAANISPVDQYELFLNSMELFKEKQKDHNETR